MVYRRSTEYSFYWYLLLWRRSKSRRSTYKFIHKIIPDKLASIFIFGSQKADVSKDELYLSSAGIIFKIYLISTRDSVIQFREIVIAVCPACMSHKTVRAWHNSTALGPHSPRAVVKCRPTCSFAPLGSKNYYVLTEIRSSITIRVLQSTPVISNQVITI